MVRKDSTFYYEVVKPRYEITKDLWYETTMVVKCVYKMSIKLVHND